MDAPLWTEGASPWPHEREAFAFVRSRLPNHEPYRAWTNVEFIAGDGSVNEVDLLVVTPRGVFIVEVKSWPGVLRGDSQRWRLKRPNGSEPLLDHPLILANTKAKRLRSLLARQPTFRNEQPPWITPLVFLSSPELDCRLHDVGKVGVCGRDPDPLPLGAEAPASARGSAALPGIVAVLKDPSRIGQRGVAVNKPLSVRIGQAVETAGLQPSNRGRKVGAWEVGALLDEGPGWQDFLASRPRVDAHRRVRIYLTGAATTAEEENRLRREAEREFHLVQGLRHDGIAQPLDLVQAERGPALLFESVEGEQRLDLWAAEGLSTLALDGRIELIRQIGEAIAHAHAHRVTHRALTARSVLVRPAGAPGGHPRLVISHWQAGARELATHLTHHADSTGFTLSTARTDRLSVAEQVYLAPEAFSVDDPDGTALDVFSLGAVAFLLLTGRPPAADLTEREALLAERGGLAPDVVADGLPEELVTLVVGATDPVPARRASVRELLELLDGALDTLTAPAPDEGWSPAVRVDPLTAHQGDVLDGGWQVQRRLGSGATAVALLCSRQGSTEPEVLKVAKDEEQAERLRDEARVLESLRHPGIVELLGIERIGGRTTLRLAPAGDPDDRVGMSLADRLAAHGRLGLDLLDRFGDDLLEIVAYLESEGVRHRDIKPDNLGVRPRRGDRSLHLVLFDFSLARAPDTSITAGTAGYLDPFLAERPGRRWDPAAERYAAAVTLYEMVTGTRPTWGDGRTDPVHVSEEHPRLIPELFDPAVRDGLVSFFARALQRDARRRYDTAAQMREAWRAVFASATRPAKTTDEARVADMAELERLADAAEHDTPVAELGLSGAAVSALERLGIVTVEQLLAFPTIEWNRVPGVGLRVRREVADASGRLRERFDADVADAAASIDRLADALVPKPTTAQARADGPALMVLLGLDAMTPLPLDGDGARRDRLAWPGPADLELGRAEYEELLSRARGRWSKRSAITQARNEIYAIVERAGGVLPADEIALALLAQRGSTSTGDDRLRRARAVVRAALETEAARDGNRFTWRRLGGGASAVVALRNEHLEGEELADYAASLGVAADQLAAEDPLPTPAAAISRLRRVPAPAGLPPLDDHRLVRLAAAASATAETSSRLEIYPRALAPERAVRLARAALLGAGALPEEQVRERVRSRFPAARPLPERPELDRLLAEHVGLEWFPGDIDANGQHRSPGFRIPPREPLSGSTLETTSGKRFPTGSVADSRDEERMEAELTDERLRRHAANGGYLVLTARPSQYRQAIEQLTALGAVEANVDTLLINHLRDHAVRKKISWQKAILAADAAGRGGDGWSRLLRVVGDVLVPLRDSLLGDAEHIVFTYPGLLARYGVLSRLLDELRETTTRQPVAGQRLRTLWVLIPTGDPQALPSILGEAVPTTTAAERLALPTSWIRNLHHTTARTGADR